MVFDEVKIALMTTSKAAEKNSLHLQNSKDDGYTVLVPRLSQKDANFNPTGGTPEESCSNCQWFLGENMCAVVEGYPYVVSGNGHSDLWRAKVLPEYLQMNEAEAEGYWGSRVKAFWEKNKEISFTVETMKPLCESCSEAMKGFGIISLKLKEKQLPEAMKAGLTEKMGQADSFFTRALESNLPDFQGEDKEAFCASLQKDVLGSWPTVKSKFDLSAVTVTGFTAPIKEEPTKGALSTSTSQGTLSTSNMLDKVAKSVRGLFSGMKKTGTDSPSSDGTFSIFRDKAGSLRWMALVTNNFRDMDNPPELIESKAHEKYIDYVDKSKNFPELWIWHVPGTTFGKADWMDYDKEAGLLWASGTIEKGKESIAERLSKKKMLAVSHGFYFSYSDEKERIIGDYRTYEISVLPAIAAANPWTSFEVILEDAKMLDTKKRSFLVEVMGEDAVKSIETRGEALAKELKDRGVQSKETKAGDPAPAAPEDAFVLGMKELTATLKETNTTVKAFETRITGMENSIKELQKSDDEKVAAVLSAAKTKGGFRASTDESTKVEEEKAKKEGPGNTKKDEAWFSTMVAGQIKEAAGLKDSTAPRSS